MELELFKVFLKRDISKKFCFCSFKNLNDELIYCGGYVLFKV